MGGKFSQYDRIRELANKHSHSTYLASPISQPESESLTSELVRAALIPEPKTNDMLLIDPFMEKQEDTSLLRVPAKSVDWQDAGKTGNMSSNKSLMRVLWTGGMLHWRGRSLELALLFSAITALLVYAFWSLGISTLDKTLSHTQLATRVVIAGGTTISIVSSSVQATTTPTVQATNTSKNTSAIQPSVQVANTSATQPSSQTTTVVTTPISYEAEASQNTLTGSASVASCSSCSGGAKVSNLGVHDGPGGTLQFNNVRKNSVGTYTLTIYYLDASSGRTLDISVNGGSAIAIRVASTGSWDVVGSLTVTVSLNAGNNTIKFFNPSDYAPQIDRITV